MEWRKTKIGNYIWRHFWYRVDWYKGERRLHKWINYAREHNMFIKITREYLEERDEYLKKTESPLNIFKAYDKWGK